MLPSSNTTDPGSTERFRFLFVTTVADTLEAFLLPHARLLQGRGHVVHAMAKGASAGNSSLNVFDKRYEIDWSRRPTDLCGIVRAVLRIRQLIRRERYQLIHVHTPVAAFITRVAVRSLRSTNRPILVYTAHGFHFHPDRSFVSNAPFLALEKIAGRWTDRLITINDVDYKSALKWKFVPEKALLQMPGVGINLKEYEHTPQRVQRGRTVLESIGIQSGSPVLVMVAEFTSNKRHADVIQAFSRNAQYGHLVLIGDGRTRPKIEQMIRARGLEQRVHLIGKRSDVADIIAVARALVLASGREGLPRSAMESLALKVPVIGTDIRGTRDVVGRCGILVGVGDIDALSEAMNQLLREEATAQKLSVCATQQVSQFELSNVLRILDEFYKRTLSSALFLPVHRVNGPDSTD